MNRNSSLLAGMLVAVALFGVSSQPNKTSESPSGDGTRKSKSASARIAPHIAHDSDKSILYSPCTEIAKRLQRFVSGATIPVESWLLPDSCYESGAAKLPAKSVRVRSEVHFAIATVPDPVSTHLSLLFDRIVESTQQAAQDNNYSYDSSWFPWNPTDKDYPLLADQQAAGALQAIEETQPGVMLFRTGASRFQRTLWRRARDLRGGRAANRRHSRRAVRECPGLDRPAGRARRNPRPPYSGADILRVASLAATGLSAVSGFRQGRPFLCLRVERHRVLAAWPAMVW